MDRLDITGELRDEHELILEWIHCGPIPVMLREHEIGRRLRRAMREAMCERDLDKLLEASLELCTLLTQHITKENHVLYRMAEHLVPDEARLPMQEAYASAALQLGAPALRRRFEAARDALRKELE